ncbi:MAG: STAS domain-containing protein [Nitrosomonadales bacterium]|nr:STAS domain-containing protein [Nitrosomonadales bacterium]
MIRREGDWMLVHGNLTIETVPAIFAAGLKQLSGENMRVDFSHVEAVDSAAISLLLGWARAASHYRHGLRITGLPDDMQSLARLYGVVDMLPQQSDEPFRGVERSEQSPG